MTELYTYYVYTYRSASRIMKIIKFLSSNGLTYSKKRVLEIGLSIL